MTLRRVWIAFLLAGAAFVDVLLLTMIAGSFGDIDGIWLLLFASAVLLIPTGVFALKLARPEWNVRSPLVNGGAALLVFAVLRFAFMPNWSVIFYRESDGGRNPKQVEGFMTRAACEEYGAREIREGRAPSAHFFCGYLCFFRGDFSEPDLSEVSCVLGDVPQVRPSD